MSTNTYRVTVVITGLGVRETYTVNAPTAGKAQGMALLTWMRTTGRKLRGEHVTYENVEQVASTTTARIEQAKQEVLTDIEEGTVPATVATFAELHDYVDANEYGGLCEDGAFATADDMVAVGNVVQDAVDAWLRTGRPMFARCTLHPAYEADYCPVCGTAQTIGR